MTQKYVLNPLYLDIIPNPIEVQAVQFTDKNKDQVYSWATSIQNNVFHSWNEDKKPILLVPQLNGDEIVCNFGDYLIGLPISGDSKFTRVMVFKKEIFEGCYKLKVED